MFMPILSGLIVSLDAFFIGLSLGLQKSCRFIYLVFINTFLIALCIIGFLIAEPIYDFIMFDPDLIVGFAFIALGTWCILHYFISDFINRRRGKEETEKTSFKTFVLIGLVMSLEAMLITIGITLIFFENANLLIPLTVGFAHFGYSSISFFLARMKYVKKIPIVLTTIISGLALIIYGLLALFVEFGI